MSIIGSSPSGDVVDAIIACALFPDTTLKIGQIDLRLKPQQDTGEALTAKTRGALFALMGELLPSDDAAMHKAFLSDTIGTPVESRADLTEAQGALAVSRLRAWQKGDQGAIWTPFGGAA